MRLVKLNFNGTKWWQCLKGSAVFEWLFMSNRNNMVDGGK